MKKRKLILASGSPRRRSLLKDAGFKFEVMSSEISEDQMEGESAKGMVLRLSKEKALAVWNSLPRDRRNNSVILAADTTVVSPDGEEILGKPTSVKEAIKMIQILQGKNHRVLTAFTVVFGDGKGVAIESYAVKTVVRFRELSPKRAKQYVELGESLDKAGAYSAQGHGAILIEGIKGSYTNVVGLPMVEVTEVLESLGVGQLFATKD